MELVVLTSKPDRWLTGKIIAPIERLNAHILDALVKFVLLMSYFLTIVDSWIGMRDFSWAPIEHFAHLWPCNFGVAFAVETLIAHPAAHFSMHHYHLRKDGIVAL